MTEEIHDGVVEDGDQVREVSETTALVSVQNSEINQQISTAKRYPRSLTMFRKSMMDMVSMKPTMSHHPPCSRGGILKP